MDSDRERERYMIFQKRIMNKILWVYENAPIFCIIGNEKFPIMQKTLREDARHRTEEDCISNCAVTRKVGKPTLFHYSFGD